MEKTCYVLYRNCSPYPVAVFSSFARANDCALASGLGGKYSVDTCRWYESDGYPSYLQGLLKDPAKVALSLPPVTATVDWSYSEGQCKGCLVRDILEPSGLCSGCEDSTYSEAY